MLIIQANDDVFPLFGDRGQTNLETGREDRHSDACCSGGFHPGDEDAPSGHIIEERLVNNKFSEIQLYFITS